MNRSSPWFAIGFAVIVAAPLSAQSPSPSFWTAPLTAEVVPMEDDGSWAPPDDATEHIFGRLRAYGTPGFWVYPVIWVSLESPADENLMALRAEIIAKFPFLEKQPASILNSILEVSTPVLESADAFVFPYLDTALGIASADAVKRAWQPICADAGSIGPAAPSPETPPQARDWNCEALVWQASATAAIPYPTPLNTWWKESADKTSLDKSIIDFDRLSQKVMVAQATLLPPVPGESLGTFFNTPPGVIVDPQVNSWYGLAKKVGLTMEIQFLGLISISPNHMTTSSEGTTGGLTGIGSPTGPPKIAWSNKIAVTFYLPRPPGDVKMGVNSNLPTALGIGGVLSLPVSAVVTPLTIRIRDSAGLIFVGAMQWQGPGSWGLQLPASFAPGNATILRLISPFEVLSGAGKPWSTLLSVQQFP